MTAGDLCLPTDLIYRPLESEPLPQALWRASPPSLGAERLGNHDRHDRPSGGPRRSPERPRRTVPEVPVRWDAIEVDFDLRFPDRLPENPDHGTEVLPIGVALDETA